MKVKVLYDGIEKEVEMTQIELEKMGWEFPKITNYPYRPRVEIEKYYFIMNDEGDIQKVCERNAVYNERHYLLGNYFYTREKAIAKRDEILTRQKAYDEEMIKKGGW